MRVARFKWVAAAAAAMCSTAVAQTEPAAESADGIADVIVTARKVVETTQQAPLAITVFSGEELAARGIENVQKLQALAPSLSIGQINGMAQITSRGIGLDNFLPGADPSVALHVDGVVVSQPGAQLGSFFDLERVEVVRGPQGTLYGRNSTGGSINLVTRRPGNDFSGYANVSYGNYEALIVEAALGGPLVADKLLARVAIKTEDRAGYGDNIRVGRDVDDASRQAIRGQILARPGERLELLLIGEYTRADDADYQHKYKSDAFPGATNPIFRPLGPLLGGTFAPGTRDINTDIEPRNDRYAWAVTGVAEFALNDVVSLKSISGYRRFRTNPTTDLDATQARVLGNNLGNQTKQFTQEIQGLMSRDRLKAVLGAYYFNEDLLADNRIGPDPFVPTPQLILNAYGTIDTESVAAFANLTYDFTEQLALNVGGRWSTERREGHSIFSRAGAPAVLFDTGATTHDFTPRVGLEWHPERDILVYASYSEGSKSGIISAGNIAPILRPEEVEAYEAGVKTTIFDRKLRANLAVYRYDITDLQISRTQPGTSPATVVTIFENAASARSQGAEVELTWRPNGALRFDALAGYLDAEFERFSTLNPLDVPNAVLLDLRGNRLVQAPEWTTSLAVSYGIDTPGGRFSINGDVQHQSEIFFTPFNQQLTSQDQVTRYNAALRFDDRGERWSATLWGRNLTDELVATNNFVISTARFISAQYAPPRTYGATVEFRF